MIRLPLQHRFLYSHTSVTWLNNTAMFTWRDTYHYSGDYYMALADTTQVKSKKLPGPASFGKLKGEAITRFSFLRPMHRSIPNDPFNTPPQDWPKFQTKSNTGYNFYTPLETNQCFGNILVLTQPIYYHTQQELLPDIIRKHKLEKNQLLIHDYQRVNTRIFNLDSLCRAVSVSPDFSLTLALTRKYAYFFDNDAP